MVEPNTYRLCFFMECRFTADLCEEGTAQIEAIRAALSHAKTNPSLGGFWKVDKEFCEHLDELSALFEAKFPKAQSN
jgi:hypothetical protein